MTNREAQLIQFMAWLLRDHAEVVSGAYKHANTCTYEGHPLSDEQKLKRSMEKMTSRCHFISEVVDGIMEENSK